MFGVQVAMVAKIRHPAGSIASLIPPWLHDNLGTSFLFASSHLIKCENIFQVVKTFWSKSAIEQASVVFHSLDVGMETIKSM